MNSQPCSMSLAFFLSVAAVASAADYAVDSHTLALWKFDRRQGLDFPDSGPGGRAMTAQGALALKESPEDSALVLDGATGLTVADANVMSVGPTGKLTYQARIWLDEYPPESNHNGYGFLMGKYEGMGLFIRSDGRLSVNNQKGNGSSWMWYAPVTARNAVPLKKWVEVAAACDQAVPECYVYVDGRALPTYSYMVGEWYQPIPAYAGGLFRSSGSGFTFGYGSDGQKMRCKVEAVKISDALVLGAGPRVISEPDSQGTHWPILPSTAALWSFDSYLITGTVASLVPGPAHTLASNYPVLEKSPYGRSARCEGGGCRFAMASQSDLNISKSGALTLEARVWLDEYPSPLLHNQASTVVGMYEGLKLLVFADGRIQAAGQRQAGGQNHWYAPISRAGAVPLGRWVDVAVAADTETRQMHAWVDGEPVQLYVPAPISDYVIEGFRSPGSEFTVGHDARDGQAFIGRIEEVRVSNALVHAVRLPVASDPDILKGTIPALPTKVRVNVGLKSHYAKAGDTVLVPVLLANFDRIAFSSCQFDLHLDTAIATMVGVDADSGLAKGWTLVDWSRMPGSPVRISMAGADRALAYGEGELVRLKLVVAHGAAVGATTALELKGIQLDENAAILPTHTPGRLTVSKPRVRFGDVTGDGQVDLSDALAIMDAVVGRIVIPDRDRPAFTLEVADVSGNRGITSYDAALVFQYALGLIQAFPVEGKPLAKAVFGAEAEAGAEASFRFGTALDAGNGTFAYRLEGSALAGLVAGELAFDVGGPVSSIQAVTSSVPSARLAWRYDAANRKLFVGLTANDPVRMAGLDFIEIQAGHAGAVPGEAFALTSAYLNEGRMGVAGLESKPLPVRNSAGTLRGAPRLAFRGGRLEIFPASSLPVRVECFDARGRTRLSRVIDGSAASPGAPILLGRGDLPRGLAWVRVSQAGGSAVALLPNLGF